MGLFRSGALAHILASVDRLAHFHAELAHMR
jgi:hypothetical protein